jgi:hypothetical protein
MPEILAITSEGLQQTAANTPFLSIQSVTLPPRLSQTVLGLSCGPYLNSGGKRYLKVAFLSKPESQMTKREYPEAEGEDK